MNRAQEESMIQIANAEGAAARRTGVPLTMCPYSAGPGASLLGAAWIHGWHSAVSPEPVYPVLVTSAIPGGPCGVIYRSVFRWDAETATAEQQEWEYGKGVPTQIDYSGAGDA